MITLARPDWRWDPWCEIDRAQRDASSIFTLPRHRPEAAYPPMNIHTGEEDVIITAEIPGIDPADIDLTVTGDTLTIRGTRKALEVRQGETWHRRERGAGNFYRTVQLPYNVDSNKVQADYVGGVLKIELPRAEADRPRKISVTSGK
jgi:HSP20 family protein